MTGSRQGSPITSPAPRGGQASWTLHESNVLNASSSSPWVRSRSFCSWPLEHVQGDDPNRSQMLMRARVIAQAVALAILIGALFFVGRGPTADGQAQQDLHQDRRRRHDRVVRGPATAEVRSARQLLRYGREANAAIGMARLSTGSMPRIDAVLGRIQNDSVHLGSDLADAV